MTGSDAQDSAEGGQPLAGGTPDPGFVLEGIGWERIQLALRFTAADGPWDTLRLEHLPSDDEERREPMPPTWMGTAEAGDRMVRFNVMLGPGQAPLAAGTWRLAVGGDAPVPVRLTAYDPIEVFLAERTFRYRGGSYRVAPHVDRQRATLELAIVQQRNRRPRPWYRRRPAWTTATDLRRRIFAALLDWHQSRARRTGRRILFTSDSNSRLAGNLAVVHDRMVARGLDREYELTTILKPSVTASRSWRDRWRLPRLLAQADVILLDDYQPAIYRLPPDPGRRIVQVWHASGAFKTVGYSRIGKPGGPSPFWRRHKNYTAAIVSGQHDVPYYAEAFGIPEERVAPIGIPRMDRFFDEEQRAAGRAAALATFPAIEGRTVILFAPTFRGHGPRDAWYDYDQVDWAGLHAASVAADAAVIVKMHPFVAESPPIPEPLRDRLIDGTRAPIDVNDLLFAVDLLITDYSSIIFEFSALLRPMLFFAYDLEAYVASRDFYVPFAEFVPGRIARTFDEVLAALRDGDFQFDKVQAFAQRHFDHLDGGATDRVIDALVVAR
ncbi:MAG TPA: CDP-glycerol glycerophosphotransferase family protein [Candidatus Limnocylindria bacterium]